MRVLARVLTALTLVAATMLLGSPPGLAEPSEQVRFLQFNMCAGNNDDCPDRLGVAERLVASLRERSEAERPHVITLNEICTSDFQYLAGALPDLGYRGAQGAVPGAPHCAELEPGVDRGAYGNAIFVRSDNASLPPTDLGTVPLTWTGGERRAITCVREHTYNLVVCVTHLTIEDQDKYDQVWDVQSHVQSYVNLGEAVVVGGDFNLTPNDDRLDPMYSNCYPGGSGEFVETDTDGTCIRAGEPTSDGDTKIDYLFLDKRHFSGWSGWVTGKNNDGSDHMLLWGSAWFDVEGGGGGGDPDPSAPPRVDAGGPYETAEGSPVRLSAGAVNATGLAWDLDGDGDYDDGSGNTPVFDRVGRDGRFTVSVRATGPGGTATDSATVRVTNAKPAVEFDVDSPRPEKSTVSISGRVVDPGWLDPLSATVDWGDGITSRLDGELENDRPDATYSFDAGHVYGDNGDFTIKVCGSDDDTTVCEQRTVRIGNVDPEPEIDEADAVATPEGPTLVVRKGAEVPLRGRVTDPGSDDLALAWDFGDGEPSPDRTVTSLVNPPDADPPKSPSVQPRDVSDEAVATYRRACVYEAGLGATDDDGGAGTDSVHVVVQDNGLVKKLATLWYAEFLVTSLPPEHLPDDVLDCYLDIAEHMSAVFSERTDASTIPAARDVLAPALLEPAHRALDRQLLAAWLNFAHGPFGVHDPVDTDCDLHTDGTFLEVMRAAEAVRLDPSAPAAEVREQAGVLTSLNLCNPIPRG